MKCVLTSGCTGQISAVTFFAKRRKKAAIKNFRGEPCVSFSKIDIISAWEASPDKGGTLDKFSGRWRIKWMETWDQDFVDLIETGYFLFDEDGLGFFMFGAVEGQLDYRITDDEARVDFSWSGNDDGDEKSGRGWFELSSSNTAKGQFFIHCGDESAVEIEKQA